jgi:hypothetical protein
MHKSNETLASLTLEFQHLQWLLVFFPLNVYFGMNLPIILQGKVSLLEG